MPYPIRIGAEVLARSRPGNSCTLACFWTGSIWHSQPEPNWIQAGFAQYDQGCLWKNTNESESAKLVAGQLHSARTEPNNSCTPTCFQTRCVWPEPDQAIQVGSGLVLHNVIWVFFGSMGPNQMREVGFGSILAL